MAKKPVQKKPKEKGISPSEAAYKEIEKLVRRGRTENDPQNLDMSRAIFNYRTAQEYGSSKPKAAPKKTVLGPPAPKAKPTAKKGKR